MAFTCFHHETPANKTPLRPASMLTNVNMHNMIEIEGVAEIESAAVQSGKSLDHEADADEAYSLTYHGCGPGTFQVCIAQTGNKLLMTAVRHEGFQHPEDVVGTVTIADWLELRRLVAATSFWCLSESAPFRGFDGWTWTIDGRKAGRHHAALRWCPREGEDFYALGTLLIRLSGLTPPEKGPP